MRSYGTLRINRLSKSFAGNYAKFSLSRLSRFLLACTVGIAPWHSTKSAIWNAWTGSSSCRGKRPVFFLLEMHIGALVFPTAFAPETKLQIPPLISWEYHKQGRRSLPERYYRKHDSLVRSQFV